MSPLGAVATDPHRALRGARGLGDGPAAGAADPDLVQLRGWGHGPGRGPAAVRGADGGRADVAVARPWSEVPRAAAAGRRGRPLDGRGAVADGLGAAGAGGGADRGAENPAHEPNTVLIDLGGPPATRKVRRVQWISTPH